MQAALAQREQSAYRQFDDSTAVMLLLRRDGSLVDANKAAVRYYGYPSRAHMQTLSIQHISCRSEQDVTDTLAGLAFEQGRYFESRHRMADGTEPGIFRPGGGIGGERLTDQVGIGHQNNCGDGQTQGGDPGGVKMRDSDLGHGKGGAPGHHEAGEQ